MQIRDQKGNLAVWIIYMMPILVVLFLFFINTAVLIDTKVRLQSAIDRGVYAGASYLAHVMNGVAELNLKFRKEYLSKSETFNAYSMENLDSIKDNIKEMEYNQNELLNRMNDLLAVGYEEAHRISQNVTEANLAAMRHLSDIKYKNEYGSGRMFRMMDDSKEGRLVNKEILEPNEIKGTAYDPEEYKEHFFNVRKYLIKSAEDFVGISSSVTTDFIPPCLTKYFSTKKRVHLGAIAAAQPYGGSIKEFAISDGEQEYLYHPQFIPVRLLVEEADVDH